jgi:hypothetical protein
MAQVSLNVPTGWEDITLKTYLELQKQLKNYEGEEEAQQAVLLDVLCGLDPSYIKSLSVDSYNALSSELSAFMGNTESPFQKFIWINGVEYGFEPNLSKMTYGAYLDITKYDTITIDENWAKIMSILYRPVIKKDKHHYAIQPYDGKEKPELFMNMGMNIHFGALFFFYNLLMDLQSAILRSMTHLEGIPPQLKSTLEKNGKGIHRYTSLLKEISGDLIK